jgi:hypothetical protein
MIKLGTLVEIVETGVRLFVVYHTKDCDGKTHLYWLSPDKGDTQQTHAFFANPKWVGGYPKRSLKEIHR